MGTFILDSNTTVDTTTFRRTDQITQNLAPLNNCIIEGNIHSTSGLISDAPADITNCTFSYNTNHGIEIINPGTYTFTGNKFTDYLGTPGSNLVASSGSIGAAIYNNSGGVVTLNITGGGDVPSVRNAANSTTNASNSVLLTITNIVPNSEIRIFGTSGNELSGAETSGTTFVYAYDYISDIIIDLVVHKQDYVYFRLEGFIISDTDQTIQVQQRFDRNYSNSS